MERRHRLSSRLAMTVRGVLLAAACGGAVLCAPTALAQRAGAQAPRAQVASPHQENILRMLVPVSVSFERQSLQNVMTFIQEYTQAELEILWMDDQTPDGLDPDAQITMRARNMTALDLLEQVLERAASRDLFSTGNGWQMTSWGAIEVGPKELLNRPAARRVQIYDINDLLFVIPTYDNAPDFDLQSVLQSGRGGGGQSPFQQNDREDRDTVPREERAQEIISLITQLVETEAWTDNGGDAATINYFQGSLIIRAPDYVHRAVGGYPWWPSSRAVRRVSQGEGERWVTLSGMTALSGPASFRRTPVTAVVPGQGGGGGGGGGGPGGPSGPPPGPP